MPPPIAYQTNMLINVRRRVNEFGDYLRAGAPLWALIGGTVLFVILVRGTDCERAAVSLTASDVHVDRMTAAASRTGDFRVFVQRCGGRFFPSWTV